MNHKNKTQINDTQHFVSNKKLNGVSYLTFKKMAIVIPVKLNYCQTKK